MPSHRKRINYDTIKKSGLICGTIYAVIGFIVRLCAKSPYNVIHVLGADAYLPPVWLFNLLSLFWFFVAGVAVGLIIGRMVCGRINGREEIFVYKGYLFFISLFFLSLMWYPLFFSGEKLALSVLIALLCVICSAVCGIMWRSLATIPSLIMGANALWLFYVMLVNILVILQN